MTAARTLQSHPFVLSAGPAVTLAAWPDLSARLGLDVAITTRHGGVSEGAYQSLNLAFHVGDEPEAVHENRSRAATAFDCAVDDLVFAEQVHGAGVATVSRADRGRGAFTMDEAVPGVDALVTDDPSVVLVTMVADCVPMGLVDPEARVLGTVHAGWRGALGGAAEAAIDALEARGAARHRVVAILGPSIGADRYQVGVDVADAARNRLRAAADRYLRPDGSDHWRFDLAGALRGVLTTSGISPARIVTSPMATGPDTPFYSDRATRPCGRFALLARLHPYDDRAPPAT